MLAALPGVAQDEVASSVDGRLIFFEGKRASANPLTANVGAASVPIPATALPCAGCHGRDGLGRPEGGVRPSDITWSNLSRAYGGSSEIGRRWETYDEYSFLRAVTEGIDSAGNRLDSSMPRYNISRRDARDLIAYLKVIQDDFDSGISAEAILVGTIQPSDGYQTRFANAILEVMRARFAEINREGGIYGRRLELEVATYEDRQSLIGQTSKMLNGDRVFALVNLFSSSADAALSGLVESAGVPSIAPYTQFPDALAANRLYTFYLHGGLAAQIDSLIRHAAPGDASTPVYVLYRRNGGFAGIADKARIELEENGFGRVRLVEYIAGPPQRLSELIELDGQPLVLFLGPVSDLVALSRDDDSPERAPRLLLPGYFVTREVSNLPAAYAVNLEMTYLTVLDSGQLAQFSRFMGRNRLGPDLLNTRLYAYGASEILIEGIKRAGKRLTRKKLVDEIEKFYAFDAGLNRPVTFGSQRRIGLRGAYIVRLDADSGNPVATDTWIQLE